MKTLLCLFLGTIVLALGTAYAQEPALPSSIGYGAIVSPDAPPIMVKAVTFNKNVKTWTTETNKTVIQLYGEASQFMPTDYFVDGSNTPIASTPTLNVRLSKANFGLAVGLGGQYDFVAGDNNDQWTWLASVRLDYALFPGYASVYIGANNLEGGEYPAHAGLAFDGPKLAEMVWGWVTE